MSAYKLPYSFYLSVSGLCLLVFGLHMAVQKLLHLPLLDHMVIPAYIWNAIMAMVIFSFLYLFRFKWKDQIGFIFIGSGLLKFVVFFIVFYPVYTADGKMETLEFSSFFVPYLICLFLETFFTAKMLNNLH